MNDPPVMWPPLGWEGVVLLSCSHLRRLMMTAEPEDDLLLCWECRGRNERRPEKFYDEWKPATADLSRNLDRLES